MDATVAGGITLLIFVVKRLSVLINDRGCSSGQLQFILLLFLMKRLSV